MFSSNAPPAPSPPSDMTVFQNGLDSAQVFWTASSGAAVTGYIMIIYYQELFGGQRLTRSFAGRLRPRSTSATITELSAGDTYSITMVATSSTLPSTVTAALTVSIGTVHVHNYTMFYTLSICIAI